MRAIEKTAKDPKDLGITSYYSEPACVLVASLKDKLRVLTGVYAVLAVAAANAAHEHLCQAARPLLSSGLHLRDQDGSCEQGKTAGEEQQAAHPAD